MNGEEVLGLLSPADTRQVIHVREPPSLSHSPFKAKAPPTLSLSTAEMAGSLGWGPQAAASRSPGVDEPQA